MSENTTRGLPNASTFEERVFAQFNALNARFNRLEIRLDSLEAKVDAQGERLTALENKVDALEDKVDARLRETRPIWEEVLRRLDAVEDEIRTVHRTLRIFHQDIIRVRQRQKELQDDHDELRARAEKLESRRTP
jgi:chromosome segregation ATPase